MHIFRERAAWMADPARPVDAVVAIGNFDGVHLGHQALLTRARERAGGTGSAGVLTFDPHPARFFAPALAPRMIMPLETRLATLAACGADFALVETFDAALAALSPEAFVLDYLHRDLAVRHVVVGYDFAFGKGRKGNTSHLHSLAASVGMGVDVLDPVSVDGLVCSSSKVREFILEGKVEGAHLLLGRPFALEGVVVQGAQRGRQLGYPTANLAVATELIPRAGIYAAWAWCLAGDEEGAPLRSWPAAVSVGTNPTFTSQAGLTVEAHLIDFQGDLYGKALRIDFVARLRDERRFPSASALVAQIDLDVETSRRVLTAEAAAPATPPAKPKP